MTAPVHRTVDDDLFSPRQISYERTGHGEPDQRRAQRELLVAATSATLLHHPVRRGQEPGNNAGSGSDGGADLRAAFTLEPNLADGAAG